MARRCACIITSVYLRVSRDRLWAAILTDGMFRLHVCTSWRQSIQRRRKQRFLSARLCFSLRRLHGYRLFEGHLCFRYECYFRITRLCYEYRNRPRHTEFNFAVCICTVGQSGFLAHRVFIQRSHTHLMQVTADALVLYIG